MNSDFWTKITEDRGLGRKAHAVAVRFLENRDYEIVVENHDFDIIAINDDTIVMVDVFVQDCLDEPCLDRHEVETRMIKALRGLDLVNMPIRYDTVVMRSIEDKILIKHHANVM